MLQVVIIVLYYRHKKKLKYAPLTAYQIFIIMFTYIKDMENFEYELSRRKLVVIAFIGKRLACYCFPHRRI